MNKKPFLALAVLSFITAACDGGIHPPVSDIAHSRLVTDISMESAKVEVRLTKLAGQQAKSCGKRCSGIRADVDAVFIMRRSDNPIENSGIGGMCFPLYYAFGPSLPKVLGFNVKDDGAELSARRGDWTITDEHKRRQKEDGYIWHATIAPGRASRFDIHYSLLLPYGEMDEKTGFLPNDKGDLVYNEKAHYIDDNKAHFIYFLRSGATWNGPIGKETVHIVADKGLHLEAVTPKNKGPKIISDNEITWEIVNIKPDEDIRVNVWPDKKPRRR